MRDNLVNDVRKKADGHWPSVLQRLDIPTNRSEGPVRSVAVIPATGLTTLSSAEPITVHIVALAQGWIWS